MQRTANGCSLNMIPSFRVRTQGNPERAVFIAPYPIPALSKETLNSIGAHSEKDLSP